MNTRNDHPHVIDSVRLLRSAALHLLNIRFGPLADDFLAAFNSGRATVQVFFTLPDFNVCQFSLTWSPPNNPQHPQPAPSISRWKVIWFDLSTR